MFDYLEKSEIESAVKIRKNASTDYYAGSKRRRKEIREYRRLGYDQWAEMKRYGMRWVATEGIFSRGKAQIRREYGQQEQYRADSGSYPEVLEL